MVKRVVLVGVLGLALVTGACGNKSDDNSLAGAAVATTTTPAPSSAKTTLSYDQAVGAHSGAQFGLVYALGGMSPDIDVTDGDGERRTVVGVLESFTWTQKPSDPIVLVMRVGPSNASVASSMTAGELTNFSLSLFSFDAASKTHWPSLTVGADTPATAKSSVVNLRATTPPPAPSRVTITLTPAPSTTKVLLHVAPTAPKAVIWGS